MVGSEKDINWNEFPLWEHQKKAISTVLGYYEHFLGTQKTNPMYNNSTLIRMPTGTGKSGVIAVIARCFQKFDCVLVLSPWTALRDQIKRDIDFRFWEKIKIEIPNEDKETIELLPSTSQNVIEKISNKTGIIVSTIQTLQTIYREQPIAYLALQNLIKIVIIDEGHREPAPEWAKAVRSLHMPAVLFSATPYRNDHKMFNVDEQYIYYFSHKEAEEKKFIREVEFVEKNYSNRIEFVNSLLDFYHGEFQSKKPKNIEHPRVIIRCESSDDINEIAKILAGRGETVIAVHERFSDTEEDYYSAKVPNPEEDDSIFWVHQHKLVEGIDDPRFCLLAIYQPFRNARALVQQVGRVIRNPTQLVDQRAYIFSHPTHRQKGYWIGYRKYEEIFNKNPDKFEPRQLFDSIIELQPAYQIGYIDKDFRERFDFEITPGQIYLHLAYARSATIYYHDTDVSFETIIEGIQKEWINIDKDVRKLEKPDDNTYIMVYQIFNNAATLIHHALLEFRIGFTIIRKSGKYLFYYDSEGDSSLALNEFVKKVPPSILENLFKGHNSRLNQISLINSDLGIHSVRRRVVNAYSIENVAPNLSDYSHFYSTAYGYTTRGDKSYVRRYVGFTRSRVTDPSAFRIEYSSYVGWLDTVSAELDRLEGTSLEYLNRFALQTTAPKNPTACNILFDLDEVESSFIKINDQDDQYREEFYLEEKCFQIEGGKFICEINSTEYEISIKYDSYRHRFHLQCPKLETSFTKINPITNDKEENIIAYVNRTQAFRIVTVDGIVYAHDYFFEPRLRMWGANRKDSLNLLSIFQPSQGLSRIGSEKGKLCLADSSGWQKDSLFDFIDHIGQDGYIASHEDFDILVCDDMNDETADFIAVSTKNKIVAIIHAKAHKTPSPSSASAFHDVCSQAIKNLGVISPFVVNEPPNLKFWDGIWKSPSTAGFVAKRIRRGNDKSENIWGQIKEIINDPNSKKEVWLVIGQGLSLQKFETERKKETPSPEIIQILYLLQSTWGATSSIGAALKIYCSP